MSVPSKLFTLVRRTTREQLAQKRVPRHSIRDVELCSHTERIVCRTLLETIKPTAYFINTARAKLVDNQALANMLERRKLVGAALDVQRGTRANEL